MMFKRLFMVGGLLSALLFLNGCSYMTNRWNDTKDIGDFGFTFSSKAQFSAYVSAPVIQIIPVGIGKVDGHFFGLGEGQTALWAPHYEKSLGLLLWGEERVSFFHTEEELATMSEEKRDEAANFMRAGVGGFVQGPVVVEVLGFLPHTICTLGGLALLQRRGICKCWILFWAGQRWMFARMIAGMRMDRRPSKA